MSFLSFFPWMLLVGVWGCATTAPPPPPVSHIASTQAPFVLSPLAGYPLQAAPEKADRIEQGFRLLDVGADPEQILALADELLADDPGFHPAAVLQAQMAFVRSDEVSVIERLAPVTDELPDYLAAGLLLARAYENEGDAIASYRLFRRLQANSSIAGDRAEALRPLARGGLAEAVEESLNAGRLEIAEERLAELDEWTADAPDLDLRRRGLDLRRRIAQERGDRKEELRLLRETAKEDAELLVEDHRRFAELELDVGDVRRGLDLATELVRRSPDDPAAARLVEHAKFLRRIELLPEEIRKLGRKPRLERAEFAALLYWVVPEVAHSRFQQPPIANDILDHPRREEIFQVLNLGLLEVDQNLHRFEPAKRIERAEALRAVLLLQKLAPGAPACLANSDVDVARSSSGVCRRAARCALIDDVSDCLPGAGVSGSEALDVLRRGIELLTVR